MSTLLFILASFAGLTTAVMGCGSSDAKPSLDGGNGPPSQTSCTIALAGGVASNHSCSVTLAYDGTAKTTDFSLSTTNVDSDTEPNLFVSIQIAGSARTGSFLWTDSDLLQGLLGVSSGNSTDMWSADSASTNTAATGSFTLTISNLGTGTPFDGSITYAKTGGSLDAVLVPVTVGQTTDAITAHAAF
jgi:hypothetical protein